MIKLPENVLFLTEGIATTYIRVSMYSVSIESMTPVFNNLY